MVLPADATAEDDLWYQWRLAIDFPQIVQFPNVIRTDPLVIRYAYPHLGTHKPTITHPPVSITTFRPEEGGETLLPNAFCAYECLASRTDIKAIFQQFPLEIALWTSPSDAKRQPIGYARVDLAALWALPAQAETKQGPPALPPVPVLSRHSDTFIPLQGVDALDGTALGFLRCVLSLEQLGQPVLPLDPTVKTDAVMATGLTEAVTQLSAASSLSETASVPAHLVEWRAQREAELKTKLQRLKEVHLQHLREGAQQVDQTYDVGHANLHHSVLEMEHQLLPAIDQVVRWREEVEATLTALEHQKQRVHEWQAREQAWCGEQTNHYKQEHYASLQALRHAIRSDESDMDALVRRQKQVAKATDDLAAVLAKEKETQSRNASAAESVQRTAAQLETEVGEVRQDHAQLHALLEQASAQLAAERNEVKQLQSQLQQQIRDRTQKVEQQKARMRAKAFWSSEMAATS